MILQACLSTVKVCERIFTIVEVLSAGKDSNHCFNHRGGLLKLVQACLSTVEACKRSFHHCRSL